MVRRLDNLDVRRTIRQTLSSGLEEVTAEYDAECESLRVPLNTVLAAKPHNWHHAAYAVGNHLSGADLTDAAWPDIPEPTPWAPSEEWGQRIALEFFRAAAARDRDQFAYLVNQLQDEPAVEMAAAAIGRYIARVLFERRKNEARERTLGAVRAVFRSVNLELTFDGLTRLSSVGYHAPPHVQDALAHWVGPEFVGVRLLDGQILPLGDRRPLCGEAGGKSEVRRDSPTESRSRRTTAAAVLTVYTGGASDETFARVNRVARDQGKSVNERLNEIDGLLRIPLDPSAKALGEMLGTSATAVKNSLWWKANRKGKKQKEIAGREGRMRGRGEVYE